MNLTIIICIYCLKLDQIFHYRFTEINEDDLTENNKIMRVMCFLFTFSFYYLGNRRLDNEYIIFTV